MEDFEEFLLREDESFDGLENGEFFGQSEDWKRICLGMDGDGFWAHEDVVSTFFAPPEDREDFPEDWEDINILPDGMGFEQPEEWGDAQEDGEDHDEPDPESYEPILEEKDDVVYIHHPSDPTLCLTRLGEEQGSHIVFDKCWWLKESTPEV